MAFKMKGSPMARNYGAPFTKHKPGHVGLPAPKPLEKQPLPGNRELIIKTGTLTGPQDPRAIHPDVRRKPNVGHIMGHPDYVDPKDNPKKTP